MSKILLTTLNARYTHTCLAIYYLKKCLNTAGIKVDICEFTINQPLLEILQEIAERKPDIVGFSVYIWNSKQTKLILQDIKKVLPDAKLILGGPEVSYNPEKWIEEFPQIDHIVCGAGETALTELILHGSNEQIIGSIGRELSEIEFPYYDLEIPDKKARYIYYESSRGCPFRCSYCLSSRSDQRLQFRGLDTVFEELDWFMKNGFVHIKFVDRTFNADAVRAREIWSYLGDKSREDIEIDFHFEVHPGILKEEDFAVLENIPKGRFRFEIGIQSLYKPTLKAIGREMNWEFVRSNILRLEVMGNISLHLDLIAGLPHEGYEQFGKDFDEVFALQPGHLQLGFLKVLPGTEMEEKSEEYGIKYQESAPYQVLATNDISFAELSRISVIEELVETYYNSGRYANFFERVMPLVKSGWEFFAGLGDYYEEQGADLQLRKWDKCAEILARYSKTILPEKSEFVLDCLRLDYCLQARGHRYPAFLEHERLDEARKRGYEYLRSLKIDDKGFLLAGEIRSGIYFLPVSEEFEDREEVRIFIGKPYRKRLITKL